MYIDTGAGYSIMGGKFFDAHLRKTVSLLKSQMLFKAVNQSGMTTRGECEVIVKLGNEEIKHIFRIVEEIGWEIICGIDFIHNNNLVLDFSEELLKLKSNERIPIHFQKNSSEVRTIQSKNIPAESVAKVVVRINNSKDMNYVGTPIKLQLKRGLYIREGVVASEQSLAIVEIVNPSRHPIKLYRGTCIGMTESVDVINKLECDMENEKYKDICKQIDSLDLKTDSLMNAEEVVKMKCFLKSFADVIAVDPKKPGVSLKVKHKINTGDHC